MGAQAPPLQLSGAVVDLGARFFRSGTVVASPALAAETIIASVTIDGDVNPSKGVRIEGFAAFLLGASGVSSVVKIRKTNVSGSTLISTGIIGGTAADLISRMVAAWDASPTIPNQVYVMTLQVASGAAESTVSAVELSAEVF